MPDELTLAMLSRLKQQPLLGGKDARMSAPPADIPLYRAPTDALRQYMLEAATKHDIPPHILDAMAHAESNYNPNARSRAGAAGIMQLMPRTARMMGVRNPLDPSQSLEGGAGYLKQLLERYGALPKALAAYNAGPTAVDKAGGIPNIPETQDYVRKVLGPFPK